MSRLLLHHFLFLWLRPHLFLCHASQRLEIVCGELSAIQAATEMTDDAVGTNLEVRIRHPAMVDNKLHLVEGMTYEVTISSQPEDLEVQGVAILSSASGENVDVRNLSVSSRPDLCDPRLMPQSPIETRWFVEHTDAEQRTSVWQGALPGIVLSQPDRTPSSVTPSSTFSEIPFSNTIADSSSLLSSPLDLASSLSSEASSLITSTLSSMSATPTLVQRLPSERFGGQLPFSLYWTAESVTTSCLTLTVVILVNNGTRTQRSQQLCKPSGCKQYFTSETGCLQSPNYPNNYSDNADCTYIIYTATSSLLELQFQMFELEQPYSQRCVDSVTVSDAHSQLQELCGYYNVTQLRHLRYVTSDNSMIVHFSSDSKLSSRGFRAVYATSHSKECDVVHRELNGTVRSPTRSSIGTYLPNLACKFSIHLPSQYRIRFYLNHFNFSDVHSGHCTTGDVLMIRDVDSHIETKMTCFENVTEGQLLFESSGSRVEMIFVSDHIYQGSGFDIFYIGVPSCRNETYVTSAGFVSSDNFPGHYANMQECFYTLNVSREVHYDVIEVMFQDLYTESDSGQDARLRDDLCSRDFLEMADGIVKHRVCGNWGGKQHLLIFRFQSQFLLFRFVSNEQITRRGFNASWQAIRKDSNTPCLSSWIETEDFCFQVLYHPQTWDDGEVDCRSRGGHLATILSDAIQLLLNQHLTDQACSDADAYWIGGTDRQWESDFYWTTGAKLSYTNWFPGFPRTGPEDNVLYGRQPSDDGQSEEDCVEMRRRFYLPDKGQNLTKSFYWNDRTCQTKNPYICQIRPQERAIPPAQCGSNITLTTLHSEQRFQSPGYPHDLYPDFANCSYFVHAPQYAILEIEFWDFQLEDANASGRCDFDFVEISTNPVIGGSGDVSIRKCGDWFRKVKLLRQVVKSFYLFLHFSTDHSKRFRGFDVTVRMLQENAECPSSPWIPVQHGCVQVVPKQIDSETDVCSSVAATLWAPQTEEEFPLILAYCLTVAQDNQTLQPAVTVLDRDENCQVVTVAETAVLDNVTVVTRVSKSNVSCNASILSSACFRPTGNQSQVEKLEVDAISQTEGQLTPTFSDDGQNYSNNVNTVWTLLAPPNHRLLLKLSKVALEEQDDCLYDMIWIKNATPSGPLCAPWEREYIAVSAAHSVEVGFHSDYSVTGPVFTLSWRSLNMSLCQQQVFTETSGVLNSFNYPEPFPSPLSCVIVIVVDPNCRVQLRFSRIFFHNSSLPSLLLQLDGTQSQEETTLMLGVEDEEGRSSLNRVFVSSGNTVSIRMERSSLLPGEGFQATYTTVLRPSLLQLDTARLEPNSSMSFYSPNFPLSMPDDLAFNMTLRAPIGYSIQMTFHYFRLGQGLEACSEVLEVDDVSLEGEKVGGPKRLARLCGEDLLANDTVSDFNSIRITYTVGNHSLRKRNQPITVIGFNISFHVRPDPSYLEKTKMLTDATFDSCEDSPCQNNATCTRDGSRARCTCPLHYTGLYCQVTWCQISPCERGDCLLQDLKPGFLCQCPADYYGQQCQINRTQCQKVRCQNAGECFGNSTHLQCQCFQKTGPFCNVTSADELLGISIGQRLLGEPIWIGLIVILTVLLLFGIVCLLRRRCAKYYTCCQIQLKPKESDNKNTRDGRRAAFENGSHSLSTFNIRRHLLPPPSAAHVATTLQTLHAAPIISVTKADDDVMMSPRKKTPAALKAEVAARFFASYREAEQAPLASPLPTDFSQATDTFLALNSDNTTVGAIVGGKLLHDLHHRKNSDGLLSKSTLSLNTSSRSGMSGNRDRMRRCHSTGPYLNRLDSSRETRTEDAGHLAPPPPKWHSLDEKDTLSLSAEEGGGLVASPSNLRRFSQPLTLQKRGQESGSRVHRQLQSPGHLFPHVIVHAASDGDYLSDQSYSDFTAHSTYLVVDSERDVMPIPRADRRLDSGMLSHFHSESVLDSQRYLSVEEGRLPESHSEANFNYQNETRKKHSGQTFGHSLDDSDRRSRRYAREFEDAGDELTSSRREMPMRRDQRPRLHHQYTVDSYLNSKSKRRKTQTKTDWKDRERSSECSLYSSVNSIPVSEVAQHGGKQHGVEAEHRCRATVQYEQARRHRPKSRHGHSHQRRATLRGEETPCRLYSRSHVKRPGHGKLLRKCSSMDILDCNLHPAPQRAHSEEKLDQCRCARCLKLSGRSQSVSGCTHRSQSVSKSRQTSSEAGEHRRQEKRARSRRDVYRHQSPLSSKSTSNRTPWTTQTSDSFSSRAEQELQALKPSSSDSEKQSQRSWTAARERLSGEDSQGARHRGIDALGSSMSDKDLDFSRRELFMKFFSQGVDPDDIFSPDQAQFFMGPNIEWNVYPSELSPIDLKINPTSPASNERLTVNGRDESSQSDIKKSAALSSKCSVIIYDDDLRPGHSNSRSRSVSSNVSPNHSPKTLTHPQSDFGSIVIRVDDSARHTDSCSAGSNSAGHKNSEPSSLLSITDTDSAVSSAASPRPSQYCQELATSSTDCSSTQRQTGPRGRDSAYQTKEPSVDMYENSRDSRSRKSLPPARTETRKLSPKAQLGERRVADTVQQEDRKVSQRLHQAAVKLFILQQRVRKGRLSRDSAVNTISEDEADVDSEDLESYGSQSRFTWQRRNQLSPKVQDAAAHEDNDFRIREEEEHDLIGGYDTHSTSVGNAVQDSPDCTEFQV